MFEILKYGTTQNGKCWVIGNLNYQEFTINDIFSTNIKDENFFKDKTSLKIKRLKISKRKDKTISFYLEF